MSYFKQSLLHEKLDMQFRQEGLILLGEANDILKKYDDNIPLVLSLKKHTIRLEKYFNEITEEDLKIQAAINTILPFEELNETEKDVIAKVTNQEKVVEILEATLKQYPQNSILIDRISNAYGSLAWYYLFTEQFEQAEQAAQRGLELDENQKWINTNLALGLLFQGKLDSAIKLYAEMKDLPYGEGTYKDTFIEDLTALEAEGIIHKDVAKIRKLLAE